MESEIQTLSEKLGPFEIKNKEFRRTLWGYCPKEVIHFLDSTARAWEGVQKNEKGLVSLVERLKLEIQEWKSREEELGRLRKLAEGDAHSITEKARLESERIYEQVRERIFSIRTRTEEWLEKVIGSLEETEKEREKFQNSLRSVLEQHNKILDNSVETSPLSAKLNQILAEKAEGAVTGKVTQ